MDTSALCVMRPEGGHRSFVCEMVSSKLTRYYDSL